MQLPNVIGYTDVASAGALTSLSPGQKWPGWKKGHFQVHFIIYRCRRIGISLAMLVLVLVLKAVNSTSLLDAIYTIAGYTYGPLLGLFAFGLITRYLHYTLGYELLILNGFLTFIALRFSKLICLCGRPSKE